MKVPNPRKLKSGTWFIQLRLGGESVPVSARTKKECINQAQLIKAEYKAGKRAARVKERENKEPTLGEQIDLYILNRNSVLSPSTIRGYKAIRKGRFQLAMGRTISSISDAEWQAFCNMEAKLCSAKTLKNAWGLISSVISSSTGKDAPKVKLPQIVPKERPFLEPEHIRPFIKAVRGTNVEIPALLALSSLRRSEIMALKWDNIDFDRKIIKVSGAAVYDENNALIEKEENKNRASARTVPIMIDELYDALKKAKEDSAPIVDCSPNTLRDRINSICKANGFPLVGVHGLRHSFVSLAYHLKVPEKIVMDIGGWSDYQTMRKIYTHISRSDVAKYTKDFEIFFSSENANKNANSQNSTIK